MGTELAQKRKLQRRRFELTDDGIRVSEDSLTEGTRYIVPYDVLFGERVDMRVMSKKSLVYAAGALGLALVSVASRFDSKSDPAPWLVTVLLVLFAIPPVVYFLMSRADLIWFKDGVSSFHVVCDQPSVEAVEAFLDEAKSRAREKLRSRLLPLIHTKDEYADRDHALFLRDKGLISEAEYTEYVHEHRRQPRDHQLN